jgi:hypothetical protein
LTRSVFAKPRGGHLLQRNFFLTIDAQSTFAPIRDFSHVMRLRLTGTE